MLKSDDKKDFKPFRQFNPVDPSWTGITYQDLAKPQTLNDETSITDAVSSTVTSFASAITFGGAAYFQDGSASAPGAAWATDLTSGLYKIGTGRFGFSVQGTVVTDWNNYGCSTYVGIATPPGSFNEGFNVVRVTGASASYAGVFWHRITTAPTTLSSSTCKWSLELGNDDGNTDDLWSFRPGLTGSTIGRTDAVIRAIYNNGNVCFGFSVGIGTKTPLTTLYVVGSGTFTTTLSVGSSISCTTLGINTTPPAGGGAWHGTCNGAFACIPSTTTAYNDAIVLLRPSTALSQFYRWMTGTSIGASGDEWALGQLPSLSARDMLWFCNGVTGSSLGNTNVAMRAGYSTGNFMFGYNVGVNTTSPRRRIDSLDTANPQLRLTYTDNSVYTDFQTNSSGNLTLTATGQTFILTSPGNPSTLQVVSTNGSGQALLQLVPGAAGFGQLQSTIGDFYISNDSASGALIFRTASSTEAARITSAGKVGINTTGPDRRLDVLDTANPQLRLTYTDSSVYTDFQTDSAGSLFVTPTNGALFLVCSGTQTQIILRESTSTSTCELQSVSQDVYLDVVQAGKALHLRADAQSSCFQIDGNRCFVPEASLSTAMTKGFINIPGAAGVPSGAPASTTGFPLYWDSTNLQLYVYTGGAWKKSAVFT